jgi:murein DD-endopeptidase MepM/ murein hydrolase activator NlpD
MRIVAIFTLFVAVLFGVWKVTSDSIQSSTSIQPPPVAREKIPPAISEPPKPFSPPIAEAPVPPSVDSAPSIIGPNNLLIPVAGVQPTQLRDTFSAARSEGRVHDAIDIMAPHNTPVVAAADGVVIRLFQSDRGGTTIYQRDPDGKTIYYYAHLDHYAEDLVEGHFAHRGDVIGYVGDTGNAGSGNYHLHFAIWIAPDDKHFWDGTNINPYPLLHR